MILAGKSVIITGAGGGIGKACALAAAAAGARVLVNDVGAGLRGEDAGAPESAEATAAEIRALGGTAIVDSGSVADLEAAKAMVARAIGAFGRLDAVLNPAGILRDAMFHKMPPADWDAVLAVHLRGAYNLAHAAIQPFRDQEAGAFVFFTSTSGLIGNLGQANYAAAKMGVVGLSRILAMEGAAKGVRANCIAPFAWTRMIASIPVKDEASAARVERMRLRMRAEQVAPLAIALCADAAKDVSGQIFGVRGDEIVLFSQPRPVASVIAAGGWSPEALLAHGLKALAPKMTDLGASASVFDYDPP